MIQVHETLTKDLKLNIAIYSSLLVGKIATKNENHMQSKKNNSENRSPSSTHKLTQCTRNALNILRNLKPKCKMIVKEVYDSPAHITLNGKKIEWPAKQILKLSPVLQTHDALIMQQ